MSTPAPGSACDSTAIDAPRRELSHLDQAWQHLLPVARPGRAKIDRQLSRAELVVHTQKGHGQVDYLLFLGVQSAGWSRRSLGEFDEGGVAIHLDRWAPAAAKARQRAQEAHQALRARYINQGADEGFGRRREPMRTLKDRR